jgi:hydrogenase maturation protease
MNAPAREPLIIGIGSPHGDDQAGWLVVDELSSHGAVNARKVANGVELLSALEGAADAVIVDASAPCGVPGRVRWFAWPIGDLAAVQPISTHGLGLVEALRLADALRLAPRRLTIVTVEASTVGPELPVSQSVRTAVASLANDLATLDSAVAFQSTGPVASATDACTRLRS